MSKFTLGQDLICVLHDMNSYVTVVGVHFTEEDGYRFQAVDVGGNGWWGPESWFKTLEEYHEN